MKFLAGIDEVGRGPLAGPVMVGVVAVPADFDWALLPGVTDSKKLSEKRREAIYKNACDLQSEGKLYFAVAGRSAQVIDDVGIVGAIREAMAEALAEVLEKVAVPPEVVTVLLDGGLKAPAEFVHQKTIIKGDATEPVIGLASIVAKVTRDQEMIRLHDQFPEYGLAIHKGYGTAAHCAAVRRLGLCPLHRRSFCRNLIVD